MKFLSISVAFLFALLPFQALALTPTSLDTLPVTAFTGSGVNIFTQPYTVPAGGQNKIFVVMFGNNSNNTVTAISLNGVDFTSNVHQRPIVSACNPANEQLPPYYAILPNPTSGTFSITFVGNTTFGGYFVTLQDASANTNADAFVCGGQINKTPYALSTTTATGNTLLLDLGDKASGAVWSSHGTGQTEINASTAIGASGISVYSSYVVGSTTAHSVTMSENLSIASNDGDLLFIAIALATTTATVPRDTSAEFFRLL